MTEKRAILGLIKSDFQPHQTFIINYDDSVTIPKATIELKIIQTMMELSSDVVMLFFMSIGEEIAIISNPINFSLSLSLISLNFLYVCLCWQWPEEIQQMNAA